MERRILVTPDGTEIDMFLEQNKIADAIDSTLDGQKLTAAGQIILTSINYVVFSDFRSGYRINFRIQDQQTRKAEL